MDLQFILIIDIEDVLSISYTIIVLSDNDFFILIISKITHE